MRLAPCFLLVALAVGCASPALTPATPGAQAAALDTEEISLEISALM